jgi:hypothetical protein
MKSLWGVAVSIALAACSVSTEVVEPTKFVSPVATPLGLVVYRDATNKFELTYSQSDFQIDSYKYSGVVVDFVLNLEDHFPGKNLEEVRVSIAVNPECHFIKAHSATANVENAMIDGISFTKFAMRDSGSKSNIFETITYQTIHHNSCYEIHINIREYALDRFPNLTEYSRTLLDMKLNDLVTTFRFIE